MRREAGLTIPLPILPEGYTFAPFSEGSEKHWADIEYSVGEFGSAEEAESYFRTEYLAHSEELKKRLVFVQNQAGKCVGTVTGWWNKSNSRRDPSIHWLAVMPAYQGLGLGRSLVYQCLLFLREFEGAKDVYLHTQTWSYPAVALYLSTGFEMLKKGVRTLSE